jgi:hypothetical protein
MGLSIHGGSAGTAADLSIAAPFDPAAPAAASAATGTAASPYFVNAAFDVAFVGGISCATFLAFLHFAPTSHSEQATAVLLAVVWLVNYPHFSATLHRLYRTRRNAAQYPFTAYLLPLVIVAGTAAALVWSETVAPYFVKLMLLWTSYHFSGQTLGLTLLYARRTGVVFEGRERRAVALFIFGTYLVYMLRVGRVAGSYYGVDHPTLEVPPWFATGAWWTTWAAGGYLLAFVLSWTLRRRRIFPVIVMLPAVTQFVWFVPGLTTGDFFLFVPVFHSLQYLPIALAMHLGDTLGNPHDSRSRRRLAFETARWCGLNFAGGLALFYSLPRAVSWLGIELPLAIGVVYAAIQLHHFIVDGVIWKLRNDSVASPLMTNLLSYARGPA